MDSFTKIAVWYENPLHDEEYELQKAEHDAKLAAEQTAIDNLVTVATSDLQASLGARRRPACQT